MYNEEDTVSLQLVVEVDLFEQKEVDEKDNNAAPVKYLHTYLTGVCDGEERINNTEDYDDIQSAEGCSDGKWNLLNELIEVEQCFDFDWFLAGENSSSG